MRADGENLFVAADWREAHDRLALGGPRELAAAAVADFGERGQTKPQRVAVAGGRKAVDEWAHVVVFGVFGQRLFAVGERAGIKTHRRDDAFAVFEFEQLLDRFAVARAGGDVYEAGGVAHAEVGKQAQRGPGAAGEAGQYRVAFA